MRFICENATNKRKLQISNGLIYNFTMFMIAKFEFYVDDEQAWYNNKWQNFTEVLMNDRRHTTLKQNE